MNDFEKTYFVYALGVTGDAIGLSGATKIGVAKCPETRLRGCQTGSPVRLHIQKTWGFNSEDEAYAFESACHKEFADKNLHLEWFMIAIEEIDKLRDSFYSEWDAIGEIAELQRALIRKEKSSAQDGGLNVLPLTRQRKTPVNPDLLCTEDAAILIGKSPSWLNKSRMSGTGPVYIKMGGGVRYRASDLEAWLTEQRRTAVYDFACRKTA